MGIATIFGYIPELHACIQYNNNNHYDMIKVRCCDICSQLFLLDTRKTMMHTTYQYSLSSDSVCVQNLSAQRFTIYLYSQKVVNLHSYCCSFTLLCLAILLFLIYPSFVALIVGNTKLMMQCELLNTNDTSVG